jgi:hypothetical protein
MTEDIQEVIEGVVRERLADARILDVQVKEDEDCDGDKVYRVNVIFEGALDAHRMAGLVRHARARLSERNMYSFPLFRFISQSDAKRLRAAAA